VLYILRLMRHPPQPDEPDIEPGAPVRAAGITPAPSLAATSTKAGA
jgi:cytochrome d ubiquinol oxidase subunit I